MTAYRYYLEEKCQNIVHEVSHLAFLDIFQIQAVVHIFLEEQADLQISDLLLVHMSMVEREATLKQAQNVQMSKIWTKASVLI